MNDEPSKPAVDYSAMAGIPQQVRTRQPQTYEELVAEDEKRKADELLWLKKIYDDRAMAKMKNDRESELRALADAQKRRDRENGV
jgi:hypothetical protein